MFVDVEFCFMNFGRACVVSVLLISSSQTDIYGTCISSYELVKGTLLVKTRHLQQCLQDKVNNFWWNSVPLKEDKVDPFIKRLNILIFYPKHSQMNDSDCYIFLSDRECQPTVYPSLWYNHDGQGELHWDSDTCAFVGVTRFGPDQDCLNPDSFENPGWDTHRFR